MSSALWITLAIIGLLWLAVQFKTGRPDGTLLRPHPIRRIMFFVMKGRNESVVYFDKKIDARPLLAYLEQARPALGANITHCIVAAADIGIAANPRLNRFVAGKRLYQRKGRSMTFSMKRKSLRTDGVHREKLATVKLHTESPRTFAELVREINEKIGVNRSGEKTYEDKEFALFDALPRPLMELATVLVFWLDRNNLLPGFFIESDGMFTSMFIANLGSLGMDPAYHHLYEYGNCPLFCMVGQVTDEISIDESGAVEAIPTLHLRYSFDERIEDGLNARYGIDAMCRVLSDPARWLGSVAEDSSDAHHLWPRDDWETDGFGILK